MNNYTIAAAHKDHQPVLSLKQLYRFLYSSKTRLCAKNKSASPSSLLAILTECGYEEGYDFFPVKRSDKGFGGFDDNDYAITLGLAEGICMRRQSERGYALCRDIAKMRREHSCTHEHELRTKVCARIEQERREKAMIARKAQDEISRTNEDLMSVIGAATTLFTNLSQLKEILTGVHYGQLTYQPSDEPVVLPEPEYVQTFLHTTADQIAAPNMPMPVVINVEGVSAT